MRCQYSEQVRAFIAENAAGRTAQELADLVNTRFELGVSGKQMAAYKKNHKLKSGLPPGFCAGAPSKLFPSEVAAYIRKNYHGCGPKEMAERLNAMFSTDYTNQQLKSYYANHKLDSGTTGRFPKGNTPPNKGKKGVCASGCEKSHFQKGNLPHNTKEIGYERVRDDGYTEVKVRMRPSRRDCNDNFVMKHRLIWEQLHGPIPEDGVVIFKDRDKQNFAPDNLALLTKAEQMEMTRCGLFSEDATITETGIVVAKLRTTINKLTKNK